ncbi:Ankyrin repeats (3 copies) [Legionella massiliensis]|uniref:Ankyrin repeats (3 copies) n=1 Tax=Legionella massiliensis TaxID=1034943 RepID=A0A078L550_9GAMM|nr:ankyrin repeat domain-containing protein [Legionella massiliensis]CDZ79038.1 Ankyrin repeats (3 copies) [Legionella massiliensis]CEE14776.1 Ankyrin repeats (3 copies) [Legionella massiliensis]
MIVIKLNRDSDKALLKEFFEAEPRDTLLANDYMVSTLDGDHPIKVGNDFHVGIASLIELAAAWGKLEHFQFLLNLREGNLSRADAHKAFCCAAVCGQQAVVEYLQKNWATIAGDKFPPFNPLLWAVRGGHLNIVEFLLGKGWPANGDSNAALKLAIELGHTDIIMHLATQESVQKSVDPNIISSLQIKNKFAANIQIPNEKEVPKKNPAKSLTLQMLHIEVMNFVKNHLIESIAALDPQDRKEIHEDFMSNHCLDKHALIILSIPSEIKREFLFSLSDKYGDNFTPEFINFALQGLDLEKLERNGDLYFDLNIGALLPPESEKISETSLSLVPLPAPVVIKIQWLDELQHRIETMSFAEDKFFQSTVNLKLENGGFKRVPHYVVPVYQELINPHSEPTDKSKKIEQWTRNALKNHNSKIQTSAEKAFYSKILQSIPLSANNNEHTARTIGPK